MRVENFVLPDGRIVKPQVLDNELKHRISLCLPRYSNDPTDKAIDVALDRVNNKESYKLMQSFTEEHPWRILVYSNGGLSYLGIAGQPESLINFSTIISKDKERLLEILQKETNKGSRMVAFAFKEDTENKKISTEGSKLLALAVLSDPVRPGVKEAVDILSQAGISTYVVTGDHPTTAGTVARAIGIDSGTLSGNDLEKLDDQSLLQKLSSIRGFCSYFSVTETAFSDSLKAKRRDGSSDRRWGQRRASA